MFNQENLSLNVLKLNIVMFLSLMYSDTVSMIWSLTCDTNNGRNV